MTERSKRPSSLNYRRLRLFAQRKVIDRLIMRALSFSASDGQLSKIRSRSRIEVAISVTAVKVPKRLRAITKVKRRCLKRFLTNVRKL